MNILEKKDFVRQALIKHAIENMVCDTDEIPRTTFLGSTDRKGYTVKTRIQWYDQEIFVYTEIDPWNKFQSETITKIEEKAKHEFANKLYEKGLFNV